MATDGTILGGRARDEERSALAREWRKLGRAATVVAVLTSPVTFTAFYVGQDWALGWSLLATFIFVIAFRGGVDVLAHKLIPRASLYGAGRELLDEDIVARRRVWYWRHKYRVLFVLLMIAAFALITMAIFGISVNDVGDFIVSALPLILILGIQIPILFLANFLILFGPLLVFGLKQMKGYEPGDADWGVRLSDVRGQKEPKQEVTRVISLWQSGDEFRQAGGKPERGLLFIGAPGTGKTMLSKGIATSFNSPIITMPGSGFAQTFIGMDVVIVMLLIRKARKLARKWGGQCMIFIDEIDAVGMRRQSLGTRMGMGGPGFESTTSAFDAPPLYGPWGALNPSGDLILENRAWRDRMFAARAEEPAALYPAFVGRVRDRVNGFMFPGMGGMGGGMALNQLLVQMDGVDEPPFFRKVFTKRFNTFLDATYLVPQRIGKRRLRIRPPRPRPEQIYFIGATNVPIDALDPALIRPGRMGRHIWFRTPTKDDRQDIFELYLGKVAHEPDLDTPERRDELSRMTNGYSPAMIEQVCSMALTYAHSDGRQEFDRADIVEAMTTIESGTAVGVNYIEEETRAVAIHEAGHAVASHVYMKDVMSTRLSIRMRGNSLGHHQAIEKEERFSSWRHEEVGNIVWTLGAMAAEHVFYGENSVGVGGDIQSATWRVARMVGMSGMGPEPISLDPDDFPDEASVREAEREIMERFERIGLQIMNRARSASMMEGDPIGSVLSDPAKRRAAAQILGQAYLTAVCCMRHNREAVAAVADALVRRRELYGDEVIELLDRAEPQAPAIDVTDRSIWPNV
ncbi:MAG TPA: AAA family ATPase [Solirubrobacteraceae bacterium]|jgi:ATP-dependent Zn protease|nr:AAA family ATPase [Solirubrobacteraceae bacterium]